MTTGFQQQQHNYGPILKSVAKPQHVGAKLAEKPAKHPQPEQHSFRVG